jgi:hypothetical protein
MLAAASHADVSTLFAVLAVVLVLCPRTCCTWGT